MKRAWRWLGCLVVTTAVVVPVACGGNGGDGEADTTVPMDVVETTDPGTMETADPGGDTGPVPTGCLEKMEVDQTFTVDGLNGPVEVVRDQWGIPHIYASTEDDLFFVQGYIQAMDRSAQMQGMRLITHGLYARNALAGPGDLGNDVYMRLLNFKGVAEEIWAKVQVEEPEIAAELVAYSKGVSAFFEAAAADKSMQPLEWQILAPFDPWTPVDILMIGRLQVWDLSFDGQSDEINMMTVLETIMAEFGGTDLEGLATDAYRSAPAADAFILGPDERNHGPATPARLPIKLLNRLPKGYFANLSKGLDQLTMNPGVPFGVGSNNWTVSGSLTETGHAMVTGDPHLSLRNPSVWHQVHLNTARAGGELDMIGVTFPGVPGILLGHNADAAWMATVHYYDVTDVYVETFSDADPDAVVFEDGEVKVEVRDETFSYKKPADGCESFLNDFVKGFTWTMDEKDGQCHVTVSIENVPHHGPVIPGSKATLPTGEKIAMTWRWTGLEPSGELKAFTGLTRMKSTDDFFAAMQDYGVGAQNIVYADTKGDIAYSAFAKVPVRKHVAAGNGAEHPPWLPMPGDGCCEWTGYVPTTDLPQALNPAKGFVLTANNDGTGATQDNDPLNEGYYTTHAQDLGYRAARIYEILEGLFATKKVGIADMKTTQADHKSPLGKDLTHAILKAVEEGQEAVDGAAGSDNSLVPFMTDAVKAATDRLKDWDFMASSGTWEGETEAQKKSAVATSIFNAWFVHLNMNVFDNKGMGGLEYQYRSKLLVAMINYPEELATWSEGLQDSLIWDDVSTDGPVESRHHIILKSLAEAVVFLADPAKVGPKEDGGFGTTDMDQWLWGELHTITLKHPLGGEANIPKGSEYPNGFPRHGDNFNVDACNPGVDDTNFTYGSGPSMRGVYVLDPAGIRMENVIPGGQIADLASPHYGDEMELWARNQTHPVYHMDDDVAGAAESCWIFGP
ncbi:MAG: penicillin acylase family protein [Deltaproteobacteria bacterium]|nr:penicillin acylase family protein [Deltaproteobacteria bacterium]